MVNVDFKLISDPPRLDDLSKVALMVNALANFEVTLKVVLPSGSES